MTHYFTRAPSALRLLPTRQLLKTLIIHRPSIPKFVIPNSLNLIQFLNQLFAHTVNILIQPSQLRPAMSSAVFGLSRLAGQNVCVSRCTSVAKKFHVQRQKPKADLTPFLIIWAFRATQSDLPLVLAPPDAQTEQLFPDSHN
jgi:hypothetical protein